MSGSENISEESLFESIVPTQQIANLENDRKNKINIPHRPRVQKSVIIHRTDDIKLNGHGKCSVNKFVNSLPKPPEMQSSLIKKNLTCERCNIPVIQTDSGKIKTCDIPKVTSHGDYSKVDTFYRKPMFFDKTINKEGGDGSFKGLNVNRWLKSNWSKLTKTTWKNQNIDILKKFTERTQQEFVPADTDVVCNRVRQAKGSDFPFVITEIGMPLPIPQQQDESDENMPYCADKCVCCRLACRMFGCRCNHKREVPKHRREYPTRAISLNRLERAHLQHLYNTPCSSVQFSMCNCAIEDAVVKKHTTAAHYFAHKRLRQVDPCGHDTRSVCGSSCDGSEVTWRSQ